MRYFYLNEFEYPKNCKWGPRPRQALLLSEENWSRINDHLKLQKDEFIPSEHELRLAEKERKKQKSQEITSSWENTLVRLKELDDQMKLERIEKNKQAKIDEYDAILKQRESEKKAIINEAKKLLFEEKDTTKQLISSVAFSAIIHERNKQAAFNRTLRTKERIEKFKLGEKIMKEAKDFEDDKLKEKMNDAEKKKQFRQFLDEQMIDVKRKEEERLIELALERQDNVNIGLELEEMANFEKEERKRSQERQQRIIDDFLRSEMEIRNRRVLEDKETDEINRIFLDVAERIETERKIREEKMIKEKWIARWRFAEKAAERYVPDFGKTDEEVEAEKLKLEEDRLKRKEEEEVKKERLVKEILEAEKEGKEEAERRRLLEREARKWEIVQKYKRQEVNENWEREEKAKIQGIKDKLKADYMQQWRENEEKREREKDDGRVLKEELRQEKEELEKYCDKVLKYTKERGRPLFPVLHAIQNVKKQCGIIKPKKPLNYLRSNVPIESIAIYAKRKF